LRKRRKDLRRYLRCWLLLKCIRRAEIISSSGFSCCLKKERDRERDGEKARERHVIAPPYPFLESQVKERGISVAKWNEAVGHNVN
jgi:hypothetical protein